MRNNNFNVIIIIISTYLRNKKLLKNLRYLQIEFTKFVLFIIKIY